MRVALRSPFRLARAAACYLCQMIRLCTGDDADIIYTIVNDAAQAYKGIIPADCWHEPYMSRLELQSEIEAGVRFWAWQTGDAVEGVMGLQDVRDVTLIRHAYVRTVRQGQGIGGSLLDALIEKSRMQLLVGTWADAAWAIRLYERHGFRLVNGTEKNDLIDRYWKITPRQRDSSVVLRYVPSAARAKSSSTGTKCWAI